MHTDPHQAIRRIIDKSVVSGASAEEEESLREHLPTCVSCREYLNAGNRAIASLDGYLFAVNPALESKVHAYLAVRARTLSKQGANRKHMWTCITAFLFTGAGSFAAWQLGRLAAAVFHLQTAHVQAGLVSFWVVPSLFICLLFLLLPGSLAGWIHEKGLSL
jgi:hypothetical protein